MFGMNGGLELTLPAQLLPLLLVLLLLGCKKSLSSISESSLGEAMHDERLCATTSATWSFSTRTPIGCFAGLHLVEEGTYEKHGEGGPRIR